MQNKVFWFKCFGLIGIVTVLASLLLSVWMAQWNANAQNQFTLKKLDQQKQSFQKELTKHWQTLAMHLIQLQSKKAHFQSVFFTLSGVIDFEKNQMNPMPEWPPSIIERLRKISPSTYPIQFEMLSSSVAQKKQLIFLLNTQQIQTQSLESHLKNKILFGLLSEKGLKKLSLHLSAEDLTNAFILNSKNYTMIAHAQRNYTGHTLPKDSIFRNLLQNHKQKWSLQLDSPSLLTSSVKIGISDSYLVLNQNSISWSPFFFAMWKKVSFALSLIFITICVMIFFLFQPLRQAYHYLSWFMYRYASYNRIPIPDHVGNNPYILSVQPWLKKIFWRFREQQLTDNKDSLEDVHYFSAMIRNLAKEIEEKHSHICIHLDLKANISLPQQKNWIRQAILEILKNAVECMNFKGKIDIHTTTDEQIFYCMIRDYGPGMSDEVLNQAFKPYYSSKAKANGLGLSLAQSALSKVGSSINFMNATDGKQGLVVQIAIPLDLNKAIRDLHL